MNLQLCRQIGLLHRAGNGVLTPSHDRRVRLLLPELALLIVGHLLRAVRHHMTLHVRSSDRRLGRARAIRKVLMSP